MAVIVENKYTGFGDLNEYMTILSKQTSTYVYSKVKQKKVKITIEKSGVSTLYEVFIACIKVKKVKQALACLQFERSQNLIQDLSVLNVNYEGLENALLEFLSRTTPLLLRYVEQDSYAYYKTIGFKAVTKEPEGYVVKEGIETEIQKGNESDPFGFFTTVKVKDMILIKFFGYGDLSL